MRCQDAAYAQRQKLAETASSGPISCRPKRRQLSRTRPRVVIGATEPLAEVGCPDLSVKSPQPGLPHEVAGTS